MTAQQLVDGAPLPDDEIWLRELTNSDFVKRDGTVHRQALKSPALGTATVASVSTWPWYFELSGRALSLITDPEADAQATVANIRARLQAQGKPVPTKIAFSGLAYARVLHLRKSSNPSTDVIYTPISKSDNAHSDFVVLENDGEAAEAAREFLQKTLKIAKPGTPRTALV